MKLLVLLGAVVLCMQQVTCQYYYGNYEYMVSIVKKTDNKLICGGAVIDDHWVLTAAQCTKNHNISTIQVGSGSLYLENADRYDVVEIHDHPLYDSTHGINDISLIKVKDSMTSQQFGTGAIPYAKEVKSYEDVDVVIAGWGLTVSIESLRSFQVIIISFILIGIWNTNIINLLDTKSLI